MPTFKSELNSIIAQIRSGNNDPELLATALQAIVDNPPYGNGYKEYMASISSFGTNDPNVYVLKNDFGQNPQVSREGVGSYLISFGFDTGFDSGNTFVDILGGGESQFETATDVYVAHAILVNETDVGIASYACGPADNMFQADNLGNLYPVIIRIRKYDNL